MFVEVDNKILFSDDFKNLNKQEDIDNLGL